jgi:hypothetical protein
MSAIITDDFRKNNANAFVTAINTLATDSPIDTGTGYYLGIGKSDPWPDETSAPTPTGSELERQDVLQNLISMKLIESSEVERLLPKSNQDWATARKYKRYDTTDRTCFNQTLSGGSITEYACYVIHNSTLYLCLSNGGGVNSTVAPSSAVKNGGGVISVDGEVGENSADGYIWVKINEIDVAGSAFKDSSTFFEIPADITPPANSTQGLLYGFKIVSAGSGYTDDVHAATLRYTQIDGTTATATLYIRVEDTEVVEVIDVDSPTGGTLQLSNLVGFGVGASNGVLRASIDFNSTQTFLTQCEIQPLIAPVEGFGSANLDVFPPYYVGIKTDFENTDGGETLIDTKFRQVSLIKNPLIDKQNDGSPGPAAEFFFGTIDSLPHLTLTTLTSSTVDSGWYFEVTAGATTGQKAWIDYIDSSSSPKKIYFHQNSSSTVTQDALPASGTITVYNSSGVSQETGRVYSAIVAPEHDDSPSLTQLDLSGEVIMLDNITPILRSAVQTEKVRIVLQF